MAPNNSFKPTPCRGIGHVLYATLAHVRRPDTGRLNSGVRRQKSVWWLLLFNTVTLPASVGFALRYVSRGVASSVKFVWRAHTSHALRWPASETVFGKVSFFAIHTVASVTSGVEVAGARSVVPASIFGNCSGVSLLSESTAT